MHRFIFLILILSFISCENATESRVREIITFKDVPIEGYRHFEIPPIQTAGLNRVVAEVTFSSTIKFKFESEYGLEPTIIDRNSFSLGSPDIKDWRGFSVFDTVDTTRHILAVMDRHDGSIGRLFLGNYLNLEFMVGCAVNQDLFLRNATIIAEY